MLKNGLMIVVTAVLAYAAYLVFLFTHSVMWTAIPVAMAVAARLAFFREYEHHEQKAMKEKAKKIVGKAANFIVPVVIILFFLLGNPAGKKFLKNLIEYGKQKIQKQEQMYKQKIQKPNLPLK